MIIIKLLQLHQTSALNNLQGVDMLLDRPNHITAYELLVLDKNTWNHTTLSKRMLLSKRNNYLKPYNCV